MTEVQLLTSLKSNIVKWFWGSLLTEIIIMTIGGLYFAGVIRANTTQNTEDINRMQVVLQTKADRAEVVRMYESQNETLKIIVDNTRSIKEDQGKAMDMFYDHIKSHK